MMAPNQKARNLEVTPAKEKARKLTQVYNAEALCEWLQEQDKYRLRATMRNQQPHSWCILQHTGEPKP